MAPSWLFWMWLLVAAAQGARDGDMRLADGQAPSEGRVEIFYRGQWGTVCDDEWDLTDASVVCRALGFDNATQALGRAAFGPGSGPIMLDEVKCAGTEPTLASCRSQGWLKSDCKHEEDASVVCAGEARNNRTHTLDLSSELSEALGQIFDSQKDCDLTIRVKVQDEEQGRDLCAHRLILTANPEAWALVKEAGSRLTLQVEAECVSVVRDFIRYFYSRRIDVSLASVKCFHQLASAYGAEQLQSFCGRLFALLLPQDPSFQTPLELYAYALASQDPVLEEVCTQFLAWNFGALIQTEAWPRVPTSLLQALLSRSELAVPSELAVLQALDKWSRERQASHGEVAGLLREVRFPMMLPEDLFQLQFNVSLYRVHEALFQKKILQALEFHTVPVRLLAQYGGRNLTEAAYWPRLYTSPTWSASLRDQSASGSWVSYAGPGRSSYNPYNRRTSYYEVASRSYYPSRSFRTPQHPSFLFQAKMVSWSFYYLPTMQSCWNYGISCSSEEPPLLALTKSDYTDPSIGYENKALVFCEERFVAHVVDFRGQKAKLPSPSGTNGSRSEAYFPCSPGPFSSFQVVVRPFYLTNSSNAGL